MRNNFWVEQAKKKQMAKYMENVLEKGKMSDSRVALLIENQRLFNNQLVNEWLNGTYGRVALAAVEKLYDPKNFLATQLVSIQPMVSPEDKIKYLRYRYSSNKKTDLNDNTLYMLDPNAKATGDDLPEITLGEETEDCLCKTRKMKVEFPLLKTTSESVTDGLRNYYDNFYLTKNFSEKYPNTRIFMEDEMSSYMADNLTNEIHAEILTDLKNNAGTVATWDYATALGDTIREKYESLYIKIIEVSSIIHRKTFRGGATWIVTSPEIAELLTNAISYTNWTARDQNSELFYHGTMNNRNRWRLFSSKTAISRDTILLGYKGEREHDSGYFYNPYIPISPVEKMPDPETKVIPTGTLSRYSKKLLRVGAKFYAKINVKGF